MFKALIGASIAGLAGAVIWAALIVGANVQSGILAWAMGGLVGFGTVLAGGRGNGAALIAALVTAASICAGKVAGVTYSLHNMIDKEIAANLSPAQFESEKLAATEYVRITGKDQLRAFMVKHGYSEAPQPADITVDELNAFEAEDAPYLQTFLGKYPNHETWKSERSEMIHEFVGGNVSLGTRLKATMGILDIAFFAFGILTALKMVSKADSHEL